MNQQAKRLAVVGECMLELHECENDTFCMGYAGDVYNVAVYFSHIAGDTLDVDFITAVGTDRYSNAMMDEWRKHGVRARHARRIDDRMAGLYLIETDEIGERDFHYYRSEAAARHMFDGEEGAVLLNQLAKYDYVYFSGITLAILHNECRDKFLAKLAELKNCGVIICFDTNYRSKLWPSREVAQTFFNLAMSFVDIALPSFTDINHLFGDTDLASCADRFLEAGAKKVILTDGDKSYMIATADKQTLHPVTAVSAVDTTGAGDSFNGAYIAAIMQGDSDEVACEKAATLAGEVVQHRGAIIY